MNERDKALYRQATGKEWAYDFDIYTAEKFADLIRADERKKVLTEERIRIQTRVDTFKTAIELLKAKNAELAAALRVRKQA